MTTEGPAVTTSPTAGPTADPSRTDAGSAVDPKANPAATPEVACHHHTNGSFAAFVAGFRSAAGRDPQQFRDYRTCCQVLHAYGKSPIMTAEELEACRAIGEEEGRYATLHEHQWKTLTLHEEEIDEVIRRHHEELVLQWRDAPIGAYAGSWHRAAVYATMRLDYLDSVGLSKRDIELQREVWLEKCGDGCRRCSCDGCLSLRDYLFPDLAEEWHRKEQEPAWQAFVAAVRRQFPAMPEAELRRLTKCTIQAGGSPDPSAVLDAFQAYARLLPSTLEAIMNGVPAKEAWELAKREIEGMLAKWRGAADATVGPLAANRLEGQADICSATTGGPA